VIENESDLGVSPVEGTTTLLPSRSSFPVLGPFWIMGPETTGILDVSTSSGNELSGIFAAGMQRSEAIRFRVVGAPGEAVELLSFEFSLSDAAKAQGLLVLEGFELLLLDGPNNTFLPTGDEPVVGMGATWVGDGTARMDLDPPLVIHAGQTVTLLLAAEFGVDEASYGDRYRFIISPSSFHLRSVVTEVDPLEVTGETINGRFRDYRPISSGLSPSATGLDSNLTAGQTDQPVMGVAIGHGPAPYTKVIDAIEVSASGSALNPVFTLRNVRLWEMKHDGQDYVFNRQVDGLRDPQVDPGPWTFQLGPDPFAQGNSTQYILVMDFTPNISVNTRMTTTIKTVGGHIVRPDGALAPIEHKGLTATQDVLALSEIPPARLTMVAQSSATAVLPRTAQEAKRIWTFAARSHTEAQLLESATVRVQSTFDRTEYLERVELWRDNTSGSDPLGSNPIQQTFIGAIEGVDLASSLWTFPVDPEITPVFFTDSGSTSARLVRFVLSATFKDAPQEFYGQTITFSMEQASDIVTRGVEWGAIAAVLDLPLATTATITPPRVTIQAGPAYAPGSQLSFCGVPYSADFLHVRVVNGPAERIAWSSIGIQNTSPEGPLYFADAIKGVYIYGDQGNNGAFGTGDVLMSPFVFEANRFDESGLLIFNPSEHVLDLNPDISSSQYLRAFPPAGQTLTFVVGATFDNPLPFPGEERVFTGAMIPELISFVGMDSGDAAEVTIESLPSSREIRPGPGSLTIRNLLTNPPASPVLVAPGQTATQGFLFEIETLNVQDLNLAHIEFEAMVIDSELQASEVFRPEAQLTLLSTSSNPPSASCPLFSITGTLNPLTSSFEFDLEDIDALNLALDCGVPSRVRSIQLNVGILPEVQLGTRTSIRLVDSSDLVVTGGCLDLFGAELPTTVVNGFPMVGRDLLVSAPLMLLDKSSSWPRNPPNPPTAEPDPHVVIGGTDSWMLGDFVARRANIGGPLQLMQMKVQFESSVDIEEMVEVNGGIRLRQLPSTYFVGEWDPETKIATFNGLSTVFTSTAVLNFQIVANPTLASRQGMHNGEQIQITIPEDGFHLTGSDLPAGIVTFQVRDWESPTVFKDSLPFHFPPAEIRIGSATVTQLGSPEQHGLERGSEDVNLLAFRILKDDTESIQPESLWIQLNGDFPADAFVNRRVRLYRLHISQLYQPILPSLQDRATLISSGTIDPATGLARIVWPAWETVGSASGERYMIAADIAPGAPGGKPFRFTIAGPEDVAIRGYISKLEVPTTLSGNGGSGQSNQVFGFTYTIPVWEIDRVWIE
jgi:hypothetical protein